jgi:type IV pilus assembly protein PilA
MNVFLRAGLIAALVASASCQKSPAPVSRDAAKAPPAPAKEAVELVAAAERSRNFAAVSRQLELGGTLYGYVDIDGDVLELTGKLQGVLNEAAKADPNVALLARQDLREVVRMLGVAEVKALGVSSVPEGNGYFRNRAYFHTGSARTGLMAALGGKPGPFVHVGLAPADAAFFWETEMDLGVAYRTLKDVVAKVAGEPMGNQLEEALRKAGEAVTLSVLDLIHGFKGRTAVTLRFDAEKSWRIPSGEGVVVPAGSLLVVVDGVGQIVAKSLAGVRELRRSQVGALEVFELAAALPLAGVKPVIAVEGPRLYAATSLAFLQECREQKSGLAQTPEFQAALASVGREGNGLTFTSPRLFAQLQRLEALNAHLPPASRSTLQLMLAQVPASDRPLVSVRTNLAEGILIRSHYNRSLKQELAMVSLYNPVTVGLLAAMAIPAFQKVRMAAQEKAVLNNLRQLAAAAEQHYLESGRRSGTFDDLVGPMRYVREVQSVLGEDYRQIKFVRGEPIGVMLPDGRMIQYPPAAPLPRPAVPRRE